MKQPKPANNDNRIDDGIIDIYRDALEVHLHALSRKLAKETGCGDHWTFSVETVQFLVEWIILVKPSFAADFLECLVDAAEIEAEHQGCGGPQTEPALQRHDNEESKADIARAKGALLTALRELQ